MTTKQLEFIEVNMKKPLAILKYSDQSIESLTELCKITDLIVRIESQPMINIQRYNMNGVMYLRYSYLNGNKKFVPNKSSDLFTLYSLNNTGKLPSQAKINTHDPKRVHWTEILFVFVGLIALLIYTMFHMPKPLCMNIGQIKPFCFGGKVTS